MCLHDSPSCDFLTGIVTSLRAVISLTHLDILNIQYKAGDWQHHKYMLCEQCLTSYYNQWKTIKIIHAPILVALRQITISSEAQYFLVIRNMDSGVRLPGFKSIPLATCIT